MRVIELDAGGWRDVFDFYAALKHALGSCEGHGSSPDAWIDSMIWGGMNEIEAPYVVRVSGIAGCNEALKDDIQLLADVIAEARAWRRENRGDDIDVTIEVRP